MMRTSDPFNEVLAAMAKAQRAMAPAVKDSSLPAFKSKYADLTAVWAACRVPLTDHGLCVLQDVTTDEHGVNVTTRIGHPSGQWIEFGPLTVPLTKRDAHGVGSATSYARRYALSAAVGVVTDDDDGNAAVERTSTHRVLYQQERPAAGELTNELPQDKPAERKAAPPPEPDGYRAWLSALEGVAEDGTAALMDAWASSSIVFRAYLTRHYAPVWQALKDHAAKVKATA